MDNAAHLVVRNPQYQRVDLRLASRSVRQPESRGWTSPGDADYSHRAYGVMIYRDELVSELQSLSGDVLTRILLDLHRAVRQVLAGDDHECPFCGETFRRFLPYGKALPATAGTADSWRRTTRRWPGALTASPRTGSGSCISISVAAHAFSASLSAFCTLRRSDASAVWFNGVPDGYTSQRIWPFRTWPCTRI